ncbi:mRNA-decapping enzyme 1A [Lampris incognitus]|uniref:mRNA-decapping enzyme 1A n=1 Tax=Lampris incognitus TaxID=2546036 RepID=UPI0024B48D69|nr:mRNA-decapping enzyme 1A [Lampris incognitus]
MEPAKAGHLMSLAALQRQDPYINKLLDVTSQVALYNFNSKTNEWEKTEIEGTLFVYARSASPHHGFTIMNRLSTENLVEPINKDLEFQLQDPFLLYRNANLGIYSIWFYDKKDCQRIAQLMVKIVEQEADHAHRESPERAGSGRTNGIAEPHPIDILELLSKAKEEYQRTQTVETDVLATSEQNVKPRADTTEHAHSTPQPEKSSNTVVKQITVEELFGSSLPKDPSLPAMPTQSATTGPSDPSNPGTSTTFLHSQIYASPASVDPLLPPHLTIPNPGASQHHLGPGLLPSPTSYTFHASPLFQSVGPGSDPQPRCSVTPLVMPAARVEQRTAPLGPGASSATPTATYLGQEILSTLKPAVPSVNSDIHKPSLAPSFLSSTLVPPQSFQESMGKPLLQQGKDTDMFSRSPNLVKPISAVPMNPALVVSGLAGPDMSVLLSPSAFQHSVTKTPPELPRMATGSSAAASVVPPSPCDPSFNSTGSTEHIQTPCSKTQLQETLIHLIKNDPAFLTAIHDAYLQSLSKDFSNMKL